MGESDQESDSKKQTAAEKLLKKFEEGARRLWSAKVVRFLKESLEARGKSNIAMILGISPPSLSRGVNQGALSLESLITAVNNVDLQPSNLPDFDSKSLQRLTGWWFAYLQLKAWRASRSPKFSEATKLFDESGRTNHLLCPLPATVNTTDEKEFTLSETVLLLLLAKELRAWELADDKSTLVKKIWTQYRNEVGLSPTVHLPMGFEDSLSSLARKGLPVFYELQDRSIHAEFNG